jgi:selenocysteine lyase/cysteine desulfurase
MAIAFDVEAARKHFPALQNQKQVFFDNAGGSQTLGSVITS